MALPRSEHSAQEHTLAEWEAQRERFSYLYLVKDKKLSEVRATMAAIHGFHATERQYKRKIAAWRLDKNIKEADMNAILRKQQKRKFEDGKESEFKVYGRPVPPQKICRFMQRKGMTDDEIHAEQMPTPSYISCSTPTTIQEEQEPGNERPEKSVSQNVETFSLNLISDAEEGNVPHETIMHAVAESKDASSLADPPSIGSNGYPLCVDFVDFAAQMTTLLCFDSWYKDMIPSSARLFFMVVPANPPEPSANFSALMRCLVSQYNISNLMLREALHLIYRLRTHDAIKGLFERSFRIFPLKFVETMFLAVLALISKGRNPHSGIAIPSSSYLLDIPLDAAGFSLESFHEVQTKLLKYFGYRIIAAPEEYEEWNIRLTQFTWFLNGDQRRMGTTSIFLPLNSKASLSNPETAASDAKAYRPAIEDNRSVTASGAITNSTSHRYFVVRIKGNSNGREQEEQRIKSLVNQVRASLRHHRQLQARSVDRQYFERPSRQYYLSSSPSWYYGFISPSNPLYYLSPLPSTSSTPNLFDPLSRTTVTPGKLSQRGPRCSENAQEKVLLQEEVSSKGCGTSGSEPSPLRRRLIDISHDWPPLSDDNAIVA